MREAPIPLQPLQTDLGEALSPPASPQEAETPMAQRYRPSFGEALRARFEAAAPIQGVSALTDLIISVIGGATAQRSMAADVENSLLANGLRVGAEGLTYVAITAATQMPPVRRLSDRFGSESATPRDTLNRIRAITAVLAAGGGTAGQVGFSAAASKMLHQNVLSADLTLALASALVSTGVISVGAFGLYKTNRRFRQAVDDQVRQLHEALLRTVDSSDTASSASMEHADALERGESPIQVRDGGSQDDGYPYPRTQP